MSRTLKFLLKKSKKPVQHLSRRVTSVYAFIFAALFAGVGTYVIMSSFAATPTTCTPNVSTMTAAAVQSAISSASAGSTVCLTNGTYSGTVTLSGITKTNYVTIQSASGTGASIGVSISNSTYLKFQNLTLRGVQISGSSTKNISMLDSAFTAASYFNMTGNSNANILVDGSTFYNIDRDVYEGRLEIGTPGSSNVGVTISNNKFGQGGCSDGIQSYANGVVIRGNEFSNLTQSCDASVAHVDALQLIGADNTIVDGNYFHDNEDGVMSPDGIDHVTFTNNVCLGSVNYCFTIGSDNGSVISHNTFSGPKEGIRVYGGNSNQASVGTQVKDNVFASGATYSANGGAIDYNLASAVGIRGPNGVSGSPVFVGGANPTTYAGFALATGSPGKGAASDGTDMGINVSGGGGGSSDTTAPSVSLTAPASNATVSGASVTLSATASDDTAVSQVIFYVDGNAVGTDSNSPYSVTWDSRTVANGSHTITARAYDTSNNSTVTSGRTITSSNASLCNASSASWQNQSFASQTGSFTVDYDATPNGANIDAVSGLSSGNAADFPDLAVLLRFNDTGTIDARNGANYTAVNNISYTSDTSYHFTITVNMSNHTYSASVAPNGGSQVTLATNYAFRTEQASVASLNNFATNSVSGSHTVCGLTVAASGGGSSSPSNTALPAISGTARVANTLSVSNGSWSNSPTSYGYQWQRCNSTGSGCSNISGATSQTYKLTCLDYGPSTGHYTLKAQVTASNSSGSASASTSTTAVVTKATNSPKGDFNDDCFINGTDVSQFVSKWRQSGSTYPTFDINGPSGTSDTFIDSWDLTMLISGYGYAG